MKEYNNQLTHLVVFPMEQKDNKIIAKRTLKYLTALVEGLWVVAFNCNKLKRVKQIGDVFFNYVKYLPRDNPLEWVW